MFFNLVKLKYILNNNIYVDVNGYKNEILFYNK